VTLVDLEAASVGSGVKVSTLRRWIANGWLAAIPESQTPDWKPKRARPRLIVDLDEVLWVRDNSPHTGAGCVK
jgi:hypothetical protein